VAIGGMAGSGTVTATVAAGAATNAAGRSSEASLSTDNTVTYTGAGVPPVCDGTHASVTIRLDADPAAATDVRFWGAYGSFQLDAPAADDGDSIFREITYNNVLPGTHTFAMSLPFGWSFGGVRCAGSGSCEEYNTQWDGARITVAACDNVTATFTALKQGTLAVTAFEDVDGNGEQGAGESGLGGWWSDLTMTQADGSQKLVASSFNDVTGTWYVVGLRPGEEYTVCQKPRAGWNNTLPGSSANDSRGWPCYTFTLASGEAADVSFGYSTAAVPPVAPEVASRGVKIRSAVDENTGYLFLPKVTAQ
jgi:hypothetical protein